MKNILLKLSLTTAIVAAVPVASASTIWNGNVDSNLTTVGNWSNNLPSSVNPGTINTGATVTLDVATTTGYYVTQSGGTVAGPAVSDRVLNGGSWSVSADSFTVDGKLNLQSGADGNQNFSISNTGAVTIANTATVGNGAARTATLSVSGGSFTTRNLILADGGSLNVAGGTVTADNSANASGFRVNSTSSMTVSGGSVSSNQELRSSSGNLLFTGGTSSFVRLRADAGFGLTLGGSTVGSLTAGTLGTNFAYNDVNFSVNWLTGSQMTFTLSDLATWAPDLWAADKITYNGSDSSTLGNWATVSSVGGLGGGASFDWNSTTRTLTVIPEPSGVALIAVCLTVVLMSRRRRCA